jgi:hypothetical protein
MAQKTKKGLKALLVHPRLLQNDTVAGAQVNGAKQDPPGILSSDSHGRWFSLERPGPSQDRKEPQDDFILEKQHR